MVEIAEASQHDEQVATAEGLLDQFNYRGAAYEANKVVEELEPNLATIARAALTKGKAMLKQTLLEMSEHGKLPPQKTFDHIYQSYELSLKLNPDCEETKAEVKKLSHLLREIPLPKPPKEVADADYDVVVVGAGASGVGIGLMLTKHFALDKHRVLLLERGSEVGQSFLNWPEEMRFISPSFNQQGWTNSFDLNSISNGTSPAYSLHSEHPTGKEYAAYLNAIVGAFKINVRKNTEVTNIKSISKTKNSLFEIHVSEKGPSDDTDNTNEEAKIEKTETLTTRYVVWAAGEYQYPRRGAPKAPCSAAATTTNDSSNDEKKSADGGVEESKGMEIEDDDDNAGDGFLAGAELCLHNSKVKSWKEIPGDDFIVIGGFESGCDAAINLANAGKQCRVLSSTPFWSQRTADPSGELAPYTAMRLKAVQAEGFSPKPILCAPYRVLAVEAAKGLEKGFTVTCRLGDANLKSINPAEGTIMKVNTPNPPILCTGFEGSVAACAGHLFEFADGKKLNQKKKTCLDGAPLLTKDDESTIVPGVFLCGPMVSHGTNSFCFVYKFRQRFGIVSKVIAEGLGIDTRAAVAECRKMNMFLDDLSCCADTCGDVC